MGLVESVLLSFSQSVVLVLGWRLTNLRFNNMDNISDTIQELVECLKKYQARYHGATHAQKLWDRTDKALKDYESISSMREQRSSP